MSDDKALVVRQGFALPEEVQFKTDLKAIARFQAIVQQELIEGVDYGEIPGTKKNTLLKPGAEKIAKLLGLSDRYEILPASIEDWVRPLFYYQVKCTLTHEASGLLVSEGLGSCNSMEDKYRYRWLWPGDVPANVDKSKLVSRKLKNGGVQYRIDNEEIYTIVNTLLKMAKKRALVDAALSAGRLSNVFTQDLEDIAKAMADEEPGEDEKPTDKPSALGNCPECGSPLATRAGKYGDFVACTGYPKCKYIQKKNKETPAPTTDSPPDDKTPPAASPQEIGETTEDGAGFDAALESLSRQIWGEDWQPSLRNWAKTNYGYSSRKQIKESQRAEIIKKLSAMAEVK